MTYPKLFLILTALLAVFCSTPQADAQTDVVAFWGFTTDYDFRPELAVAEADPAAPAGRFNLAPDIDNTVGMASMEVYLGLPAGLDGNGGGGFKTYVSPVSGVAFGPTRTIKWDDLKGAGPDFDIGGVNTFQVDKNDGMGPITDVFDNDALVYLMLDGTGYQDFQIRFDIEGTPGLDPLDPTASDLPSTYDIYYRTSASATWYRDSTPDHNNIDLVFSDLDPANPDPDNQVADSGYQSLNAALNNNSQIEIIISDFANEGNNEMELDNIEIVANVVSVPEPGSAGLILMAGLGLAGFRRRR